MEHAKLRRLPVLAALFVATAFVIWSYCGQTTRFSPAVVSPGDEILIEVGRPMPFVEIWTETNLGLRQGLYLETLIVTGHSPQFKLLGIMCDLALLVTLALTSAIAASWITRPRITLATALGITAFAAIEAMTRWRGFLNNTATLYEVAEYLEFASAAYAGIIIWIATLIACIVVANLVCALLARWLSGHTKVE